MARFALPALFALLLLAACTGGGLGARGAPSGPAAPVGPLEQGSPDAPAAAAAPDALRTAPTPSEDPYPTGPDPRLGALRTVFEDEVAAARTRLAAVTGLTLPGALVELAALGDEGVPFRIRSAVREGRRVARITVNAEPLVSGRANLARVLLRALGAAAYEDPAPRGGPAPAWLKELAATAAAGDLDQRVEELARRLDAGEARAARVDPADPQAAEATGAAALLLLTEAGRPGEVRRFLRFAAEGDDPSLLLGRLAREPGGEWVGRARTLLLASLDEVDLAPGRLVREARRVFAELGRAGLEAWLPAAPPAAAAADLAHLRAEAAAREGDLDAARALLRALPEDAAARLSDPAGALALGARIEARPGGDAARARHLAQRLDFEHPRSPARLDLRREHPLLGLEEDPRYWVAATRERIARDGVDSLSLATAERYARLLLVDLRSGEAARFLAALGERAGAPELLPVGAAVAQAEREPSPAAVARAAEAVARWELLGDEAKVVEEVRAAGGAALPPLAARLERLGAERRAAAVRLMARAGGADLATRALAPRWERRPAPIAADLEALLAEVPAPEVRDLLPPGELRRLAGADPEALWARATLGLPEPWLTAHPDFLVRLAAPAFATRREAFEAAASAGGSVLTPALVARGLRDPAVLLREAAARAAGQAGFFALARLAAGDAHARVREAGLLALARLDPAGARALLFERLAGETEPGPRRAAALGLWHAAPDDPAVLDALFSTLAEEGPTVREPVARALRDARAAPLAEAVARALDRASRRANPIPAFLVRVTTLYHRVTGHDLGYLPGAPPERLRAMARAAEAHAEREARQGPSGLSASRGAAR